jgi:hypothetical protein
LPIAAEDRAKLEEELKRLEDIRLHRTRKLEPWERERIVRIKMGLAGRTHDTATEKPKRSRRPSRQNAILTDQLNALREAMKAEGTWTEEGDKLLTRVFKGL